MGLLKHNRTPLRLKGCLIVPDTYEEQNLARTRCIVLNIPHALENISSLAVIFCPEEGCSVSPALDVTSSRGLPALILPARLTSAADGELMSRTKQAAVQPWRRTAEVRGQSGFVGRRCSDDKAVTHAATFRLINGDGARAVSRRPPSPRPNALLFAPDSAPAFVFTLLHPRASTQKLHTRAPTVKAAAAATQQADHFSVEMREKCLQSCKCAMCLAVLHYIGGP